MGQCGFLCLRAFEACVLFIFKTVGFSSGKLNLVVDGRSLFRRLDGVELLAEVGGLFAKDVDFAIEARTEGLFAAERGIRIRGLALGGGERSLGLRNFAGKRTHFVIEASAVNIDGLEFYEAFNQRLHP